MRADVTDDNIEVEGRDGVVVITGSVRSLDEWNEIVRLLEPELEVTGEEQFKTPTD